MISTLVSVVLGLTIKLLADSLGGPGRIVFPSPALGYVGCSLMVWGMALQWAAVATLKDKFTVDVAIRKVARKFHVKRVRQNRLPYHLADLIRAPNRLFKGLGPSALLG